MSKKSLWLEETCKCGSNLFTYIPTNYHIRCYRVDCSQCNEFKEEEFKTLRELKKKYKLKIKENE